MITDMVFHMFSVVCCIKRIAVVLNVLDLFSIASYHISIICGYRISYVVTMQAQFSSSITIYKYSNVCVFSFSFV